jgi:Ni/Fe-hydrogenase subunit HybB-like protein
MLTYLPQDITARFTTYFPSLIEYITGAGVVAFGLLALSIGVRYLNVIDHRSAPQMEESIMVQLSAVTD